MRKDGSDSGERIKAGTGMEKRTADDQINRRRVGEAYEKRAGAFLEQNGYRILEYNFRCRNGEIDIVARDGSVLTFVEVKYRSSPARFDPLSAVDIKKQRVICRCADFYMLRYGYPESCPCRFDVVAMAGEEIRLVRNAFDYIPAGRRARK